MTFYPGLSGIEEACSSKSCYGSVLCFVLFCFCFFEKAHETWAGISNQRVLFLGGLKNFFLSNC